MSLGRGHRAGSRAVVAAALVLLAPLLAGCWDGGLGTSEGAATDWSPAAASVDGLSVLAESDAEGFRLHTASGDQGFLPGVNLGSTTPLHQPGEVAGIEQGDYRRWLGTMGDLGVRVVRIYTLLPPGFYAELAAYNEQHADAPLYLVQGVYLPDEGYIEPGRSLYDEEVDRALREEIADISDAVHGDLVRRPTPGRAHGRYDVDVSRWLAGWIVGVEWDGEGVQRTDRISADEPYRPGRFFRASDEASATERWIAGHLDELAEAEAARGVSAPVAFVNWPTTDPLEHPTEPLAREDLVGVDPNHVLPTDAWPGGTFASFHAYPYYPDFQRYEPGLEETTWQGEPDRYAGYLRSLQDHVAEHMPLLVTEYGVPSSLGSAHAGTNGRDQGGHSEQQAMAMNADMMRMMADQGIAGAFVFAWSDEWFKRTWNTMEHQDEERRQLWHDPLTNEQWFGLLATDPEPVVDAAVETAPEAGAYEYVHTWADASWVHMDVTFRDAVPDVLTVEADVVPGPERADYRITLDRAAGSAALDVRRELDPIRLDTGTRPYRPDAAEEWHRYALIINRAFGGSEPRPAEYQVVGDLRQGTWDPAAEDYDSRSTWQVDEPRRTVRLRIPWSMLGMADPSARTALGEGEPAEQVTVPGIDLRFAAVGTDGSEEVLDQRFTWPAWNNTGHRERLKAGVGELAAAFRDLAP